MAEPQPEHESKYMEPEKEEFENGRMALKQNWKLIYDSGAALEPFYFWIVDFADKIGFDVIKVLDTYSFSYRSPEWQNQQQKMHYTLQDATSLMASIGQIIKSIVAVKKDYQRVKEALDYYKKNKEKPNDIVLKGIWIDNVDTRSGPASFAQATKNLQFYSARDWFFRVNSEKDIEELPTNKRIKSYLKRKLKEYNVWKKHWKNSLEDMKNILEERIKAQKGSVDLYKKWVAPMVKDIEGLSQERDMLDPNLIKMGSAVYGQVKLVCFNKNEQDYPGFVAVVEIDMSIRGSSPKAIAKTFVKIQPCLYREEAFEKKKKEWEEDPVDRWIENLMLEHKFTEEEKKEEKPKTFVGEIMKSIKENYGKKQEAGKSKGPRIQIFSHDENKIKKAKENALNGGWLIYDIAKKAWRMLGWPVDREYKVQ